VDQLHLEAFVDFAAQPADVALDDVGARVEMNVPDVLEQHRARDHLAGVAHQVFKQAELPWLQLDQLPTTARRAAEPVPPAKAVWLVLAG
jgi:hypothetical protein